MFSAVGFSIKSLSERWSSWLTTASLTIRETTSKSSTIPAAGPPACSGPSSATSRRYECPCRRAHLPGWFGSTWAASNVKDLRICTAHGFRRDDQSLPTRQPDPHRGSRTAAALVRAVGVGLEIEDAGDVKVFNCDPDLFERMVVERAGYRFHIPVAKRVPARVMGSGLGRQSVARGDYDIQCFDEATVREFGLRELRLGDLVAIVDADNSFGRVYRSGAVTIGVVAHGMSYIAGHGPGVTTILTSASGAIEPCIDAGANLATILGLR